MKHTGGKWDPDSAPLYFIADDPKSLDVAIPFHQHVLCPANVLTNGAQRQALEEYLDAGHVVLMDSGVFNLAVEHAKVHGLQMDEARSMPPDQLDGFDALYSLYVDLVTAYGDQVWGYIEIDIGGRANKTKTRRGLERKGLRPIPVYHPIQDGWGYFDELARDYDRICVGNLARTGRDTRKRIMSTIWQRRQKYPKLWVHMLGVTPSEIMSGWPVQSCDSSAWLNPVRWQANYALLGNYSAWELGRGFHVRVGEETESGQAHYRRSTSFCAYTSRFRALTMQTIAEERASL